MFFSAIICLWFLLSKCSIDLKKNVLVIGTTGSKTTFLPEGELPECARLAYGAGRDEVRPEEIADQELAEALQKSVLEEAFVFTSLETWVSGGAWDRGSEWGPVPMGAASGACQQLATFPVSSTAWLGSLHDRGLRGIHVGVGQGHSL